MPALFKSLAELLERIEDTKKRLEITRLTADFIKTLDAEEVGPAVSMMLGRPFPKWSRKNLDVSWTTLTQVLLRVTEADWNVFTEAFLTTGDIGNATKAVFEKNKPKKQTLLLQKQMTIAEVSSMFEAIAETTGQRSREKKERLTATLLSQASPIEAKYIIKIIIGEMRTGLQEGLMEQAVAQAFEIPLTIVRRASMALGDISEAAAIAKTEGKNHLATIGFKVFRPVKLMLAQTADNVTEALKMHEGKTAFEYKYDGARVQIHKQGNEVEIFSRRLTEVTQSLPETVTSVKNNVKAEEAILEGEVIAVDSAGFPIPFQHLMRRFKRVHEIPGIAEKIPVKLYLFDVLYLNGET